jgi:VWFA-related protein
MATRSERNPRTAPALASFLCFALAATLEAQPSQPFVDSVDVQVVEVDVVVTDRKGRPVKGLKREDFELYVDGRPAEITNFYESPIYLEEQPGRRKKGRRPVIRTEAAPRTAAREALTVVFYLDDLHTFPPHRTRLLRRLQAAVEPWRSLNASFILARFVNRLEVLVPPTPDLDAILEGAGSVRKGAPRAIQNGDGARRYAIRSLIDRQVSCAMSPSCRPCIDNWGELLARVRQYAAHRATNTAIAVDGLADLVTTLSGVPGKKAVVYVTDGLPQRPGSSLLDFVGNGLCRDQNPRAASETMAEMMQYDESRRFSRLSSHANANRVTFYGVDASGVRDAGPDIALDNAGSGPSSHNASLHSMNAQSGLHLLARETGGKALINANDLSIVLDDMTAQLAASYSLGFIPAELKPDEEREIAVLLAPGADDGHRIAYRRTFRDKPVDERLAERLLSVAYLGNAENPLEASIEFGGTKLLEKEIHELTVGVSVPAESVLSLSGGNGASPGAGARLRLWLVAVEDEKGARTAVRQKTIDVGGAAGVAAEDGKYRVEVAMNLPEGDYLVAAGIRDERTGLTSLIREPVSVPSAEAATEGG